MTDKTIIVIKRDGHRPSEKFDKDKLHHSIIAACLSVRSLEGHAHDTANRVCDSVLSWLGNKSEVTSADIRHQATSALEILHPDAAYLYKHHRVII